MFKKIADDVVLGEGAVVHDFTNLYGCTVGARTKVGTFVEIQRGAVIGDDCKISSHTFICDGVTIGNGVFVGHNVTFINDKNPRAVTPEGTLEQDADWQGRFIRTVIGDRVSIGSSATIMGGITIGEGATIGAGSVVTKDVGPGTTVAGVPARVLKA